MNEVYLNLQRSETAVTATAATIFAAYVGQGMVDGQCEDDLIDKSVALAIKLVQRVDKMVKSDEEWTKPAGPSGAML